MDRNSLRTILDREGVDREYYELEGGLPSDKYCMEARGLSWAVYYSERGQRVEERAFLSEDDACRRLLELLLRDPTTRVGGRLVEGPDWPLRQL